MAKEMTRNMVDEKHDRQAAFGVHLRKWRLDANLSQQDVAKRLGFKAVTNVSGVELGNYPLPPSRIMEWSRALGVKPKLLAMTMLRYYEPYYFHALYGEKED